MKRYVSPTKNMSLGQGMEGMKSDRYEAGEPVFAYGSFKMAKMMRRAPLIQLRS